VTWICGRPLRTAPQRTCTRSRAWLLESKYDPEHWVAPACGIHMTAAEKAEGALVQTRLVEPDPACWAWPVPPPREFADDNDASSVLHQWHAGRCAICGFYEGGLLEEDHDHRTMLVRGRLCHPCNVLEGFEGNGTIARYRQRPPAAILGVRIRYWNWNAQPSTARPVGGLDLAVRAVVDRIPLPRPEELAGPATQPEET